MEMSAPFKKTPADSKYHLNNTIPKFPGLKKVLPKTKMTSTLSKEASLFMMDEVSEIKVAVMLKALGKLPKLLASKPARKLEAGMLRKISDPGTRKIVRNVGEKIVKPGIKATMQGAAINGAKKTFDNISGDAAQKSELESKVEVKPLGH